jgi:DNA ligase-1
MIYNPIYKRATNGKINKWTIEVESNKYRTISGYSDGVQTTSEWTICEGKNIGKKNETTDTEQAKLEAEAMYRKRKELGYFENINECDTQVYFQPMLAKDWNDEKHKVKFPVASQRKYDGVRCIIKSDGMWSRNGKQIISAPHIYESLKELFETNPDLVLDGELYTDKEFDFNKIISCVKKTKPTLDDLNKSKEYIKYFIYDLASDDNSFNIRYNTLKNMFDKKQFPITCVLANIDIIQNESEINKYHDQYVSEGFEGQIIRILEGKYENKRSKFLLKNKVFNDDEFIIIGVKEGLGKLSGKVGKLVFQNFESAVNGEHSYLEELWNKKDKLIGLTATVRYFGLTTTDIPVPRFPKVINIGRETYE